MDDNKLQEIYKKLKAEQDRLEPVLSIRHMAETLGHTSHSYIQKIIPMLIDAGLAEEIPLGEDGIIKRYRMIEKR